MAAPFVTVVSGLPRSGTSMLMRMLEAGGMEVLSDGQRRADEDNPRGYYELERVKKLPGDTAWLGEAPGRAVKVISALLEHLPAGYDYRVVFLRRRMDEVLASQRAMLLRRGVAPDKVGDERMGALFERHVETVAERLRARDDTRVLWLHYHEVVADPAAAAAALAEVLDLRVDAATMAGVVEAALYRQRAAG